MAEVESTDVGGDGAEVVQGGDSGREPNTTDRVTLERMYTDQRAKNVPVFNELGQRGVQVPPQLVLLARMDTLIDVLLGPRQGEDPSSMSDERLKFELAFEDRMGEELDRIASEVRKAILVQGVQNGQPPKIVRHDG